MAAQGFPDRDSVADKLAAAGEADKAYIKLLMENAAQDENPIEGLHCHLDRAAAARFLNTIKLETLGLWLGEHAPARLQVRLMEAAKSSRHPAFAAFQSGLVKSGGLRRAYPPANI